MQQYEMQNRFEAEREYAVMSIVPGFAVSEFVSNVFWFILTLPRMCLVIQGLGYAQGGEGPPSKQPTRNFGLIG